MASPPGYPGMERWRGKVALVTGASAGIGYTTAKQLTELGMNVVGCARNIGTIEVSSLQPPRFRAFKCPPSNFKCLPCYFFFQGNSPLSQKTMKSQWSRNQFCIGGGARCIGRGGPKQHYIIMSNKINKARIHTIYIVYYIVYYIL